MDLGLNGEVVLITGGTDGLGLALAEVLVAEGARVALCGRDAARARSVEEQLQAAGGDVVAVAADVSVAADLERFVQVSLDRWGQIDGVVNNAGRSSAGGIEATSDEEWQADFDLKVMAAVRLVRLALPHLRSSERASVVNVLNIGSKAPGANSLPTSASRAAGLAITKSLSKELAPSGVRVNALLIGLVESGQWRRRASTSGQPLDALYASMGESIPLGRVGRSEEFADVAAFLLSPRSSYVTGSAINIDGGASPVL
jgi:NAD(P)-dependent dehydrogenase (short-subunit alcohol dehydrogenase family)